MNKNFDEAASEMRTFNHHNTLAYHREMCTKLFGKDSAATKFLDDKITANGPTDEFIVDERQLIVLLYGLHMKGLESAGSEKKP